MASAVIVLGCLISAAVALSLATGRRLHRTLPLVVMAFIVWLYAAYLTGFLHPAAWIILVGPISLTAVWWRRRKRRGSLPPLLPELVGLTGIVAVCLVMTRNARVALWDEMRLWGAYPKILHETAGALQIGPHAQLVAAMQEYTPGLALYQCGLQALGAFSERALYFGYAILCSIFPLPLLRRARWQRPVTFVLGTLGAALLPLYFANAQNDLGDHFRSLYVEPLLGVMTAYACHRLAAGAFRRWTGCLELGLLTLTAYLVKNVGGVLALAVLIPATILVPLAKGHCGKGVRLARVVCLWLPLTLGASSWHFVSASAKGASAFNTDYGGPWRYVTSLPAFVHELSDVSLRHTLSGLWPGGTTFAALALALTGVAVGLLLVHPRQSRGLFLVGHAAVAIVVAAQLSGVHVLTVAAFGGTYLSSPRYLSLPLTTWAAFLALRGAGLPPPGKRRRSTAGVLLLALSLSFLALQAPLRTPRSCEDVWFAQAQVLGADLRTKVREIDWSGTADNPTRVFIIHTDPYDEAVGLAHRVYLDSIGTGVLPDAILSMMVLDAPGQPGTAMRSLPEILSAQHYEYVYVPAVTPELTRQLGQYFAEAPQVNLYRVQGQGAEVRLTRAA